MFEIKVTRMNCGGCAKSVTRAIRGVDAGATVAVDLGAKLVTVSGGGGSFDRIAQAITAAGFPAEPA